MTLSESYGLSLGQMCWHFIEDAKAVVGKNAGAIIQIKAIALHRWCLYSSNVTHTLKNQMPVSLNNDLDATGKYYVRQNGEDT